MASLLRAMGNQYAGCSSGFRMPDIEAVFDSSTRDEANAGGSCSGDKDKVVARIGDLCFVRRSTLARGLGGEPRLRTQMLDRFTKRCRAMEAAREGPLRGELSRKRGQPLGTGAKLLRLVSGLSSARPALVGYS